MNSAGYDEILNEILELYAQYLSKPLTYVHNTSIIQGNFPERLIDSSSCLSKQG
jgi:hypothetical protein